jgi:PAS domain S-box-containing protein
MSGAPRADESAEPREDPGSEIQRLRRLNRDLISLLAQPAIGIRQTPSGVVHTLVEVLLGTLRVDLAYARVTRPGEAPVEAGSARARHGLVQQAPGLGAALDRWLRPESWNTPIAIENPLEPGEMRLLARRFGLQEEGSVVAVGSSRRSFPTASETLLFQVAVNQAVTGFQAAELLQQHRRLERVAVEAASLRLFGRVVETSSDFMGICTPDGKPIFLNEAGRRMVGLDSAEDVGRTTLMDYFWPEDRRRIEVEAIPALVREGRWSGEVRFRHFKTGAPIPTMWNAFVIKDDAGAPAAWATVSPDLTALKKAEEALRQANARLMEADRRKNEFLGVLSHELRNPLAPITSGIYTLDHVPADCADAARAKDIIRRQAGHLRRIVDDLLDVTRISQGKIELSHARIDLREPVLRACEDHASIFGESRIELRHDLPARPVWIDADAPRISQVLGNLLQNAVKFTDAGGTVAVSVAVRSGNAEISVRDTGVGMASGDVDRMFEPFAQADQGLARSHWGARPRPRPREGARRTPRWVRSSAERRPGARVRVPRVAPARSGASGRGGGARGGRARGAGARRRAPRAPHRGQRRHLRCALDRAWPERAQGPHGLQRQVGDHRGARAEARRRAVRHRPAGHRRVRGRPDAADGRGAPFDPPRRAERVRAP